jgi:hypothetical protein
VISSTEGRVDDVWKESICTYSEFVSCSLKTDIIGSALTIVCQDVDVR